MRLIDADIAIEQLSIDFPFMEIQEKLIKSLDTVPTVQAIPQWIPVIERLPEEHKEVLTCSFGGFIEIQSFEDSYGGYWENQNGVWSNIDEVIAWMPLPEPYEGSDAE